jgi:tRNA-dihydrouridine synthase B
MLARGMMGNPWLIRQASALLTSGEVVPDQTWEEHIALCRRLVGYVIDHHGEHLGVRLSRKFVSWSVRGVSGAAKMRDEVQHLYTRDDVRVFWERLLELAPSDHDAPGIDHQALLAATG